MLQQQGGKTSWNVQLKSCGVVSNQAQMELIDPNIIKKRFNYQLMCVFAGQHHRAGVPLISSTGRDHDSTHRCSNFFPS